MSEKIYAYLLRLYPASFRDTYGKDALQLFRDRLREETGFLRRTRLWFDIFLDLAISLPRLILEDEPLRPAALLSGCAITLAVVGLLAVSLNQSGALHAPSASRADVNSASRRAPVQATFGQSANGAGPAGDGSIRSSTLNPERQHVLDAVIADVEQHYFDPAIAHQTADALRAHQRRGDDAAATTDKHYAALLTTQMREVSHDLHLEVVYTATPPMPAPLEKDNCSFKKVEILPHNVGYLKLDAFLDPSGCGPTATGAMASLNNVNALIFDLRDNRGGSDEMVSLISSYLFDHPEYMFDPRRVPTPRSWTSSPVPGSKLANKPVYILTSSTTISAAEQFTYNLKMLKRATIVGEVTAGGAHAGVWHRIDDQYGVAIPEKRAVNPYAQADWEAIGIQPDIKVPADAALQTALRQAQSQIQGHRSSPQHD
jgi:Peptidase family S41